MLDEHPLVRNIAVAVGFLSIVGGSAGIMWNIYAEAERSIDQTARLMAIQHEQVAIRKELALQTADLEEIRRTQGMIVAGQEHTRSEIGNRLFGLATELGRVSERHRLEEP